MAAISNRALGIEEKVLKAADRKKLKSSSFVFPGKRAYPIHDPAHARAALSMVARHGTPAQKKAVKAAVRKKYPSIGGKGKKK
jgi:hypothetical protein